MQERAEQLILVDSQDREIGTVNKREAHSHPLLHRAFSVFLIHDNTILLQKRAEGKYHSAGLWANSCCSHPRVGEELLASAEKRLLEELGMTCPLREIGSFVYLHRFSDEMYEYEYDHVLVGDYFGAFHPDLDEIAELRWVSAADLSAELLREPGRFAPWFLTAAPMVLRHLFVKQSDS